MNDHDRRRRNQAVVERAFAAVGAGDVAAQLENFSDDAVLELPYSDPPVRLEGKEAIGARLGPALDIFQLRLEITAVYECCDPDTLVMEYTSDGEVTTTEKPYRNSYVAIVRFRDGLICFQREYYNPGAAAEALSPG